MRPVEGSTLGGRYTLDRRIAAGGMGEVWQASDTVLGRTVAVKVLASGFVDDTGFTERFRAEARHTASLSHTNIAAVHDYGEDAGSPYLVMEFVDGVPLSQLIRQHAPMAPDQVCRIVGQAAEALEAAHRGGLIHRDVKPANILITPSGTAKLTDFGISRAVGGAAMTRTGEVMGTAQYLAPEQAMGRPATAASDVYSLGIVTYEMLTGTRPFDRENTVATALAQINDPPPPLPRSVPPGLRGLVEACLAKDPALRPPSGGALAAAVRQPGLLTPEPEPAVGAGPPDPSAARGTSRLRWSLGAGLAVVIVAAVVLVMQGLGDNPTSPPEPTPTPTPIDTHYTKTLEPLSAPAPGSTRRDRA